MPPSAVFLKDVRAVTQGLALQSPLYKKKAKTAKGQLFVSVVRFRLRGSRVGRS